MYLRHSGLLETSDRELTVSLAADNTMNVQVSKRETLLIPHRRGEGSLPLRVGSLDKTISSPQQLRALLQLHK